MGMIHQEKLCAPEMDAIGNNIGNNLNNQLRLKIDENGIVHGRFISENLPENTISLQLLLKSHAFTSFINSYFEKLMHAEVSHTLTLSSGKNSGFHKVGQQ